MNDDRARAIDRFRRSLVARMATVAPEGHPHIVPVTFAIVESRIVTMVDAKPKTSVNLKRLSNIAVEPRVSLLADHYEDDWSRLWWTRIDGTASVERAGRIWETAQQELVGKYPQYRDNVPEGPAIVITIESVTWWEWSL